MLMRAKNIIFLPKYYFLQYILTRPTDPHSFQSSPVKRKINLVSPYTYPPIATSKLTAPSVIYPLPTTRIQLGRDRKTQRKTTKEPPREP